MKRLKSIGLFIFLICMLLLSGCNNMKFNQTDDKSVLIKTIYSSNDIEALKVVARTENISFSKFKRDFKAECIRKTHQGYYVVLQIENNSSAFVYFNEENELTHIIIKDKFLSKNEFETQVLYGMLQNEVLQIDSSTIFLPVSIIDVSAHIVKEGVFLVYYERLHNGNLLNEPIVTDIQFIENADIPRNEDSLIRYETPYILDIDKQDWGDI